MKDLQIFNYQDTAVRTAELNGGPAIVLADIAKVLGYRDANTAGRILRDHHKGYAEVRTPGGTQQMTVVTEKGFNRLVMRSNAKNAEDVQDWITDDVLPTIRKTGSYGQVAALPSRAALAQMVLDAEKEIEAAKMQAELDAPKIRYHERFVAEMDDVQTIDMFATDWGTTGPKVRELLRTKGVAVRRILGRRWSKSKQRMVDVPEWRPRQGTRYSEWFVVRPQHDAPRHHNGQVRTTMYLLRFHAEDLAQKLGLKEPAMFDGGDAA